MPLSTLTQDEIEIMGTNIGTVRSLCDKVVNTIGDSVEETPMIRAILDIRTAITHLSRNQEILVGAAQRQQVGHAPIMGPPKNNTSKRQTTAPPPATPEIIISGHPLAETSSTFVDLGALAKKPKPNQNPKKTKGDSTPDNWEDLIFTFNPAPASGTGPTPGASIAVLQQASAEAASLEKANTDRSRKLKRFKEAVEKAERSTLIMNLDLGKTPTINQETISTKITLALSAMAAEKEGEKTSMPTPATLGRLDDVLSVSKSMSLFGKTTKSYHNPKDPKSGAYCTIPVKYEYRDRATRLAAERVLRDTCGAHCATPYPTILRECIKRTVNDVKEAAGDVYVKVTVDTRAFCLRVQRQAKKNGTMLRCNFIVPLPEAALDVDARRIPKDFYFEIPCTPGKPSRFSRRDQYKNSLFFNSPEREKQTADDQENLESELPESDTTETMDTGSEETSGETDDNDNTRENPPSDE